MKCREPYNNGNKSVSKVSSTQNRTGISWFETKMNIVRNAVNQYIRNPHEPLAHA